MAIAVQCVSSCLSLNSNLQKLSLTNSSTLTRPSLAFRNPLGFSSSLSYNVFSQGSLSMSTVERPVRRSTVCEAAPVKKADSAAKRARQAEKRRLYNRAYKSEVRTRMKKVLEELEVLRKKQDAEQGEIIPIEKLIGQAYSAIDKAIKVGTLHRNTGANRKSRLARRKKAVEIHHGWFTPEPVVSA